MDTGQKDHRMMISLRACTLVGAALKTLTPAVSRCSEASGNRSGFVVRILVPISSTARTHRTLKDPYRIPGTGSRIPGSRQWVGGTLLAAVRWGGRCHG